MFTRSELQEIADFAIEKDILVLSDEVYETLVFSDSISPHITIGSLPGMFERTIAVGSVGKTFSVTVIFFNSFFFDDFLIFILEY